MRTKVLALSALVGAIGAVSAVAQTNVYSINAVGYINLTVPPGFSQIGCQLLTTNNTVAGLLNDASGIYDGCTVYKWSNTTGHYSIDNGDSQGTSYANGWDNNGTITMNPGEAVWFHNGVGSNLVITFVGTVPQGTNVVALGHGFNMLASPVPFSGDLVTNMGFTNYEANADGSTAYVFNNPAPGHPTGAYTIYNVDIAGGGGSGYNGDWDAPGDPQLNVGQGFWFNASAAFNWTQVFSINP
jgi:hypothetical protein